MLFTSVAGLLGNAGQADYAAANEALCRLAASWKRQRPDCHVTAIDWGAWDGGMDHFHARGVWLLDPEVGAQAFVEQFGKERSDDVCALVGEDKSLSAGDPGAVATTGSREPTWPPSRTATRRSHPCHAWCGVHEPGEPTAPSRRPAARPRLFVRPRTPGFRRLEESGVKPLRPPLHRPLRTRPGRCARAARPWCTQAVRARPPGVPGMRQALAADRAAADRRSM
ncbi:KR domain-containing protein [Saccharopolyspora elongata]|uniref:KR domain-containing protein n=1 Tax=Saccharopolyspora elongata TaxID=2530387 RepID=UPI0038B4B2EB